MFVCKHSKSLLPFSLIALLLSGCSIEDLALGHGPGSPEPLEDLQGSASDDDDDDWGDDDDDVGEVDLPPPPKGDPISVDVEDEACDLASSAAETWFMSTDDSNSQAAPVLTREQLLSGYLPSRSTRIHEFLNYYSFGFEPAEPGTVRVVPQLRADPNEPDRYSMGVGVIAPHLDSAERRPIDITFSIDTSCSMGSAGMAAVQATMRAISGSLNEGDTVGVVSWSSSVATLLPTHTVDGPNDLTVLDVIEDLDTEGSTNLHAGLVAAYDLAATAQQPGRLNRVILLSDGGANAGVTDQRLIAQHADDGEDDGIYLVGVLTPGSGYNDGLMDTITDVGKGAYIYIPNEEEAERMFTGERFLSNLELAARNIRLELTLPPGFVIDEFHGEEASQDPSEVKPQHLAPNDAMLYHMDLAYCDEAASSDRQFDFVVTWEDIETRESRVTTVSASFDELMLGDSVELAKADAILAYAKLFDALQLSSTGGVDERSAVETRLSTALNLLPGDSDLLEVQGVLGL
jgi:Ca-activated chloride channel family protein